MLVKMENMERNITCNCSAVDGEFFIVACGVGLRLRFRADWPDCGDNALELVVVGDVAAVDEPELAFTVLRTDGGDLFE